MKEQEKIEYVKPAILDLGPVSPIHGGMCIDGSMNNEGCEAGDYAGGDYCNPGFNAHPT